MLGPQRVRWRETALVAAAVALQVGVPVLTAAHGADTEPLPLGGVALLLAGVAAIPLRLRWPVPALALAFAATLAYSTLDYDARGPIFVSLIVCFGNVVLTGHRRVAIATMVVGYAGFLWLAPALDRRDPPSGIASIALAAWLLVLYTAAELIRLQRDRLRESAAAREDALQRQVANERLAIARELHDVVAHNMSLINLQAGVALHLDDDLPERTRQSLQTIKAASREALAELRSILGVLRHVDVDGDGAPLAPTPGLANLEDLLARARSAGVDVRVAVDVDPATLPRAVDVAAYRILQESLTNVARHAEPPAATVDVHGLDDALVVSVVNAGTRNRRLELPNGGNGLPGMQERAASVGGTLVAGPRAGGGFGVEARLPLTNGTEEGDG